MGAKTPKIPISEKMYIGENDMVTLLLVDLVKAVKVTFRNVIGSSTIGLTTSNCRSQLINYRNLARHQ